MRAAFLIPLLAGCATVSGPGELPARAAVEEALVAARLCDESDGGSVCHNQPRRTALSSLRCRPVEDGRVLCIYAGAMAWMDGTRTRIDSDCAYLSRSAEGRWRIAAFPDADVCGT